MLSSRNVSRESRRKSRELLALWRSTGDPCHLADLAYIERDLQRTRSSVEEYLAWRAAWIADELARAANPVTLNAAQRHSTERSLKIAISKGWPARGFWRV